MPSFSLLRWRDERVPALDELESAHQSVGGTGRGRRYATQQINQAYAVLLSSQFQGFCRDLHSECADCMVQGVSPGPLRDALLDGLMFGRRLDRGNPNAGNIGEDFNRFGLAFWNKVRTQDQRNSARQDRLKELNDWRNAIAHQDFDQTVLGATTLRIQQVREWRRSCEQLAVAFDEVMRAHLQTLTGSSPW